MASVAILISMMLVLLVVTAWGLSLSARMVGSPRGKFRFGLLALLIAAAANGVAAAGAAASANQLPISPLAFSAFLGICDLCVIFIVLKWTFRLSFGRTFAPMLAYFILVAIQLGVALAIVRPYLTEAFVMPTHSMMPTINPGDRFLVNKRLSPRRWDLVAYNADFNNGQPQIYCKRLIGLPGERLRIENGNIYINDQLQTAPPTLAGHLRASPSNYNPRYKEGETIVLGNDDYFFVGDNSPVSGDSRMTGPSPRSSLVGVVDAIYWPLSKAKIVR